MEQRIAWDTALASLSLAFALSVVVAWIYSATHAGLSYLRGFTQSLALGGIISAAVMLAIGDDVARGLGVVGALTIVRFRTCSARPRRTTPSFPHSTGDCDSRMPSVRRSFRGRCTGSSHRPCRLQVPPGDH